MAQAGYKSRSIILQMKLTLFCEFPRKKLSFPCILVRIDWSAYITLLIDGEIVSTGKKIILFPWLDWFGRPVLTSVISFTVSRCEKNLLGALNQQLEKEKYFK